MAVSYNMPGQMNTYSSTPPPPQNYSQTQTNPEGAAADPFAYTQGSLLTPWQGRFSSSGSGGGYSVPAFNAFNYADFGYNAPSAGRFDEKYADPAAFRFADFNGPSAFKAPTAEDMKADPGYQARMDAGMKAQTAAGAHSGAMRTGGFAKGMSDYAQNAASQEYGKTYDRKAAEWDRNWGQAKETYAVNQGNTKQAFDTNVANKQAGYGIRQGAWKGNADVALQEGQLGYQIAQGTWDRNSAKARQGWDDQRQYDASVAAAASANANQSYERDLGDYNRARDEFWTNQDRQYGIIDNEDRKMMGMTSQYGAQLMGAYGQMGGMAVGGGDAAASGYAASGNAWGNAMSDVGNMAGGMMMYGAQNQQPQQQPQQQRYQAPRLSSNTYGSSYAQQPYGGGSGNMGGYR